MTSQPPWQGQAFLLVLFYLTFEILKGFFFVCVTSWNWWTLPYWERGVVYLYLCISREYPSTSSTILWVPSFLVLILNPPSLFHLISGVGIPWARHVNRAVSSCSLQYKISYSAVQNQLFCSIKPVILQYKTSYSEVQNQLFCSTKPVILQYKTSYSEVQNQLFCSIKPVIPQYKTSYTVVHTSNSAVLQTSYSAVQNQLFCSSKPVHSAVQNQLLCCT